MMKDDDLSPDSGGVDEGQSQELDAEQYLFDYRNNQDGPHGQTLEQKFILMSN